MRAQADSSPSRADGQERARIDRGHGGMSIDLKPHAYDPATQPGAVRGRAGAPRRRLRHRSHHHLPSRSCSRRCSSSSSASSPSGSAGRCSGCCRRPSVIWALFYYGVTFGSPASATIGMRVMDLEMRTWYGAPAYFVLGAVHAIVFWITVSVADAAHSAGRLLQRAPAAAARHPARHGRHQQSGAAHAVCGAAGATD